MRLCSSPTPVSYTHLDDVLATGGTMAAAVELVRRMHPKKIYVNFIIELTALNGRKVLPDDVAVSYTHHLSVTFIIKQALN